MKWNSFESHLLASQKELYFTKQFSDVTLVSDDLAEFLAHKTILSTASPLMKSLLGMSSQQQSSFLYLKGVTQENLEAILQYIYLGETEINEQKVQEFTKIAKDLGISILRLERFLEFQPIHVHKNKPCMISNNSY